MSPFTADVNYEVGANKEVSIRCTAETPFVAERPPMYFEYTGRGQWDWTGGHCVIGAGVLGPGWFFAEGYMGEGFHEWLCLQNPGTVEAAVEITYLTQESGALPARRITVPAASRKTVFVNTDAGAGYQLSVMLQVVSGGGIVVERPVYLDYGGTRTGGHDIVGYTR